MLAWPGTRWKRNTCVPALSKELGVALWAAKFLIKCGNFERNLNFRVQQKTGFCKRYN